MMTILSQDGVLTASVTLLISINLSTFYTRMIPGGSLMHPNANFFMAMDGVIQLFAFLLLTSRKISKLMKTFAAL